MGDGQSGNGNGNGNGSVLVMFDPADLKEMNVLIRGLNITMVNLTNAVNRFTLSAATVNRDRSQVDKQILDGLAAIREKLEP